MSWKAGSALGIDIEISIPARELSAPVQVISTSPPCSSSEQADLVSGGHPSASKAWATRQGSGIVCRARQQKTRKNPCEASGLQVSLELLVRHVSICSHAARIGNTQGRHTTTSAKKKEALRGGVLNAASRTWHMLYASTHGSRLGVD